MINQKTCFTPFKTSVLDVILPERFTFPFYYEPHPLCLLAAQELQTQLQNNQRLVQEFEQAGKMFGVLLVKTPQGDIGYLCAFSGKLLNEEHDIKFVPPVFDVDAQTEFFHDESLIINQLNSQLEFLLKNPQLAQFQQDLTAIKRQQTEQLDQQRHIMAHRRQSRKLQRQQASNTLPVSQQKQLFEQLAKASVNDKNTLRDLKHYWSDLNVQLQKQLDHLTDEIELIKSKRKQLSNTLQNQLFKQYRFLNSAAVEKNLVELFLDAPYQTPPAGAGDCAAPKLLQYAFQYDMTPLAMAEFWWGQAPKSEIRQHKKFYGACIGKCKPILTHMLAGMELDDDPLLINPAVNKTLEIVYQDDAIVVVNKPSGLLSVQGKNIEDSVYIRIKKQFPKAVGTLIVHRLDMSTSGLMVLALTKRAQKNLQKQFISRTIKKRYVAILEGQIDESTTAFSDKKVGEIALPLRGDFDDRPRQLVCFEHGKPAKTQWKVIEVIAGKTKLYLYPETGRTHQLRVHCAHPLGLKLPILGDDLYGSDNHYFSNEICGKKAQRLHLHAEMLTLNHPITREVMTFQIDADF